LLAWDSWQIIFPASVLKIVGVSREFETQWKYS